ncbi:MAG: ABC transporter substrate-binding protein [Promethearchaeota archaeon]
MDNQDLTTSLSRNFQDVVLVILFLSVTFFSPVSVSSVAYPSTNYPLLTENRDLSITILCDIASEAQKNIAASIATQLVTLTTHGLTPSEKDSEVGIMPATYATTADDLFSRLFSDSVTQNNLNYTFQAGGFDLALIEWTDVPWPFIFSFFESSRVPERNFFFFDDNTVDTLYSSFLNSESFLNRSKILLTTNNFITVNHIAAPLSFQDSLFISVPEILSIDVFKPGRVWNWVLLNTTEKNITYVTDSFSSSFCPIITLNSFNQDFNCLLFDYLYEETTSARIVPNLAQLIPIPVNDTFWKNVQWNNTLWNETHWYDMQWNGTVMNGTHWKISFVTNATFSDGVPFTADDVVFTINAMRNDTKFAYYDQLTSLLGNMASYPNAVEKVNDSVIHLSTRFCEIKELLLAFQIPIFPAHLLQNVSASAKAWKMLPERYFTIGTGPFIIKNTNQSDKLRFQKRSDLIRNYHRPQLILSSTIDNFTVLHALNFDKALELLQEGNAHVISDHYEAGCKLEEITIHHTLHVNTGRKILALFPNHAHPILHNQNIRKGIHQSINSVNLTVVGFSTYATPAKSIIAPASVFYNGITDQNNYLPKNTSMSFTLGIQELISEGILVDKDNDGLPDPRSKTTISIQSTEEQVYFITPLELLLILFFITRSLQKVKKK